MDISVPVIGILTGLVTGLFSKLRGKRIKLPGGNTLILNEKGRNDKYTSVGEKSVGGARLDEPYLGGTPFDYPPTTRTPAPPFEPTPPTPAPLRDLRDLQAHLTDAPTRDPSSKRKP